MEERISMGSLVWKIEEGYIIWDRGNRKFRLCQEVLVEEDEDSFLNDLVDALNIARSWNIKVGFSYGVAATKVYFNRCLDYFSGRRYKESSYPWF